MSAFQSPSTFEICPIEWKHCWSAFPLVVSCPRKHGPEFQRGLDHRLLIWCLLTATVAEEGIEACCLITRVSRLRILQELMFSRERYRWNITSVFPPFRSRGTFVAVLFWSTPECFAFTISVPRLQRHRYWWAILQVMAVDSFLLGRKCDPALLLFPSRTRPDFIARPYHGICSLFVVSAPGKLCI